MQSARFSLLAIMAALVMQFASGASGDVPEGSELHLKIYKVDEGLFLAGNVASIGQGRSIERRIREAYPGRKVTNWTQVVESPIPQSWRDAIDFGLTAFRMPAASSVELIPGNVTVMALPASLGDRQRLLADLEAERPPDLGVSYDILVPRPVVVPYMVSVTVENDVVKLLKCHVETQEDRDRIVAKAVSTGRTVSGDCVIALEAPSELWGEAIVEALDLLLRAGGGSMHARDARIFVAPSRPERLDALEELAQTARQRLPDQYSLKTVFELDIQDAEPSLASRREFALSRDAGGLVEMRGPVRTDMERRIISALAMIELEGTSINDSSVVDPQTPEDQTRIILQGIEALKKLHDGTLEVDVGQVRVSGVTVVPGVEDELRDFLTTLFGAGSYRLDIAYDGTVLAPPSPMDPRQCMSLLEDIQAEDKLIFEPSKADLASGASEVIERIAAVLGECSHVGIEIAGHTDDQGREEMNLRLSTMRARMVLDALVGEGLRAKNLIARGYGESRPIADNESEQGRSANRRIEFNLLDEDIPFPK